MADILCQLREEANLLLLENGTAGVGGLEKRELGYAVAEKVLSWALEAGGFAHFPSQDLLANADTAEDSGAAGIGYFPSGSLSATNLQDAMDQLEAQVAASAGGNLLGTLTPGKILKATAADTAADSILSEAADKILFDGDTVANLYRSAAGYLQTDGGFGVTGQFDADGLVNLPQLVNACGGFDFGNASANNAFAFIIAPTLDKNNSNARTFSALLLAPTLNPGGSNASTLFNLLNIDPESLTSTGLAVNLLRLGFNGSDLWTIDSSGNLVLTGGGQTVKRNDNSGHTFLCGGASPSSSDGAMIVLSGVSDATWGGTMRLLSGGAQFIEFYGDTFFDGFEQMKQRSVTPTDPADGTTLNRYFKGTKFILQYNDGGTVRYKYLEMSGAGATWADATSAP